MRYSAAPARGFAAVACCCLCTFQCEGGPAAAQAYAYTKKSVVGEGTYGTVYKAERKETGETVALKKVNMANEKDGFPITAIREIQILTRMVHPCTVKLIEIVTSKPTEFNRNKGTIFMVFEYMQHDLTGLIDNPEVHFTPYQVKLYMQQMLAGLDYMHSEMLLHRDIKGANMLVNDNGVLKIADFGLSRVFTHLRGEKYTHKVVTLWYRPPEILLGDGRYKAAIDLWSVGIVFAEVVTKKHFFHRPNELSQLAQIFQWCGSPLPPPDQPQVANQHAWTEHSRLPFYESLKSMCLKPQRRRLLEHPNLKKESAAVEALQLLDALLVLDPSRRLTAEQALAHPYFQSAPACDYNQIDTSQLCVPTRDSKEMSVKASRAPAAQPRSQQPQSAREGVGLPRPQQSQKSGGGGGGGGHAAMPSSNRGAAEGGGGAAHAWPGAQRSSGGGAGTTGSGGGGGGEKRKWPGAGGGGAQRPPPSGGGRAWPGARGGSSSGGSGRGGVAAWRGGGSSRGGGVGGRGTLLRGGRGGVGGGLRGRGGGGGGGGGGSRGIGRYRR
jgi:cyclin-dependent kinase 12/13